MQASSPDAAVTPQQQSMLLLLIIAPLLGLLVAHEDLIATE
jgi:hypothetical protein